MLDFKKAITTRGGSPIRIYHIYKDKIHGAYYSNNDWYQCAWTLPNGFYLSDKEGTHKTSLDLVNDEPYEP